MGIPKKPKPVRLFVGMITRHPELFTSATSILKKRFGKIYRESEIFPFEFTNYYTTEMGEGLLRKFVSFEKKISPDSLAKIKLYTNKIEKRFAVNGKRQINIDPGIITPAQVVLASTKEFSHRIYLMAGIYAEVTLIFKKGRFEPLPWTYPDYRTQKYLSFFHSVRK